MSADCDALKTEAVKRLKGDQEQEQPKKKRVCACVQPMCVCTASTCAWHGQKGVTAVVGGQGDTVWQWSPPGMAHGGEGTAQCLRCTGALL